MRRRVPALLLLSLLAPACTRNDPDPKWELAIRQGMPFVGAVPLAPAEVTLSEDPAGLKATFESLFVHAFLRARTEEYLVLESTGPQRWLRTRVLEDDWRALHVVLKPDQDLVLRCYPRVGAMESFESDFFADSPKLKGGTWYHVTLFVRLFRQLSRQPVRDLRLDLVAEGNVTIRFATFSVERER